jgi:hypothetical protein
MLIVLIVIGSTIDSYLHDHKITFHYKIFGGLAGIGVTLFTARQLKNLFVRKPVKKE